MSADYDKNVFANNLKYYMEKRDINSSDLAKYLSVSKQSVSFWINGIKIPRIDKIEMIANYFGINKSDLIEDFDERIKSNKNSVKIPVLGCVQAGLPIEAVENIIDYEEISAEMARSGDFFGLKIRGDSMEPKFSENDVIIVRKQPVVDNGDIAVVMINGDEATVKKFYKLDSGIQLVSTNTAYQPFFFTPEEVANKPVSIIGKVVELRAKF